MDKLLIKGAREHNLKNVDLELPRDKLIVISGLSGSGKSSLAFDTIYAEGQRRYVESLSAYARQFLGRLDKPDIDYIEGLSPAISIEQKTTHRNPRSTVGTVTEIYDHYRLLFARIGQPHCPVCGQEIREQSVDQIIDAILTWPPESRLMIMAPLVAGKKGEHEKILGDARTAGFARVRIDGRIYALDDLPTLNKKLKHTIEVVVDRVKIGPNSRKRVAESVETALDTAEGRLLVVVDSKDRPEERFFSRKNSCGDCNISVPELQPRLFSFNSPYGACPECSGLGMTLEFSADLVIPDERLSIAEGAVLTHNPKSNWSGSLFKALAKRHGFSLTTPIRELPAKIKKIILFGSPEKMDVTYVSRQKGSRYHYTTAFSGIMADLKRRYLESQSEGIKKWLETFMRRRLCPTCRGQRLKPDILAVTVGDQSIQGLSCLSVDDSLRFFANLDLSRAQGQIAEQIVKEITARLRFMQNVGLGYLTLERAAGTLSGGEAQRIRLATQIGAGLVGVFYILDEPSIGLHQRDNQRLIETLKHLRDIGNTLIVVEHDEQTLRTADYLVDLGPGAGEHGGHIVAKGSVDDLMAASRSLTGDYLSGKRKIEAPEKPRPAPKKWLTIEKAGEHNLKNIDVSLPLGRLVLITGVSGSGKSTLVNEILYPALLDRLGLKGPEPGRFKRLTGAKEIDKIINIDQSPIGRTPRSNPATYVGLFTPIRDLFAVLPESRARGYKPGRFSFNVAGGRCENCKGDGTIRIEMHFLPDVYITCDVCKGRRFNQETLDIRYRGKNIQEVLAMTVEEARRFFAAIPAVSRRLETLAAVGLDYIRLGQSALTLSGGEAQRVKLALELAKVSAGRSFYLLDEPTTGLHFEDVKKLMEVIQLLVDKGNTVVLIEHNLDVIKQADHIVDLGPEGGPAGGQIVAQGSPAEVASVAGSHTGRFLKSMLEA